MKRIKNGIIALIFIISATQIVNLVTKYFSPDINGETSIGEFRSKAHAMSKQGIAQTINDIDNRKMIVIDGNIYVRTNENVKKDLNGDWFNSYDVVVDIYKLYDDCQGFTKGSVATEQYYVFKWRDGAHSKMSANTESWSWNFVFPANYRQIYGDITNDKDWDNMKKDYKNSDRYSHPMWQDYSQDNNPYRDSSSN